MGKMKLVRRLGPIVLALSAFTTTAEAQVLFVKTYTHERGFPGEQLFAATQDRDGYLWFGGPSALLKYDGAKASRFTVEHGRLHDSVRSILEFDGALWLTSEKGVCRFDGKTCTRTITEKDGLGRGIVWRAAAHKGAVWFGTSAGGLTRVRGDEVKTFDESDGLVSLNVFSLFSDGDDLWVGTRGGGLHRFDGRRFHPVPIETGLTGREVMAIAKLGRKLWVGTRDAGLFRRDGARFVAVLPGEPIYSVGRVRNELWWGSLGRGVFRTSLDKETKRYDTSNGLSGDRIYSVFEDREGNVWLATNHGATKIVSDAFHTHLPNTSVVSVAHFDDTAWFGTLGKGLFRLDADRAVPVPGLEKRTVWSIAKHQGRLWLGTGKGVVTLEDGVATARAPSLAADGIYDVFPDGDRIFVTGTFGACVIEDGEDQCKRIAAVKSLTYRALRHDGRVCFATEAGLVCGDQTYGGDTSMLTLYEDRSERLWLGALRGLFRLEGAALVASARGDTLLGHRINAIGQMKSGALVLGSDEGVTIWAEGKPSRHYDRSRGLAASETNFGAISVGPDGDVFVGTPTGVTHYRPHLETTNGVAPLIHLRRAQVNGKPTTFETPLRHDENNVSFAFDGLSFVNEDRVRFRYQLVGWDDEWSEPSRQRTVRYTNLPAGRYGFRVQARSSSSAWSETAATSFEITPAYWNTWAFRVAVTAGVAFVVFLIVRLWIQAIQRRNEELEALVRERTRELEELSLTDPLTRLRNRRFLAETIATELARSDRIHAGFARGDKPATPGAGNIGFMLIDVDRFKEVNDRHGHAAGDELLVACADALRETLRATDALVRWGGEEFLVMCRDVDTNSLRELSERVATAVREREITLSDGTKVSRTCSIGFSLLPFEPFDWEDIVGFADSAMYIAKSRGRDRVVGIVAADGSTNGVDHERMKGDIDYGVETGHLRIT